MENYFYFAGVFEPVKSCQ